MPSQFPDESTERHLAPDPALMEAARARGRERWASAGDLPVPEEKPPSRPLNKRVAAIALIASVLLLAGIAVVAFSGGDDSGDTDVAQPTHSYIPGLITPPEELPESSSASNSANPTLASSALGLIPPTTTPGTPPPGGNNDGNRAPAGAKSSTTGPGCGGFTGVGSYRDGRKGWVDHGDGKCGNAFVSIPMSGDARRDDASAYGQWTFTASGSCDISVFIPNGNLEEVGGNPTVYYVFDRNGVGGTPMASFAIKQVDKRGQWVAAGKFKASGNLTVQLLTRGQDWNNSGPTYAHHAASAVRADCTA
ncbi:hypothetical protein ABZX92_34365 [Lentzea sp. NPDC006480]|uniref:hypothetical protein n=1 Tax=Lentzea sp. NPDC006480 TaxID=3157176 RepID=UPI0033B95C44